MTQFLIVPFNEKDGNFPPEKNEFSSIKKAQEFLINTQEQWAIYDQVLIVNKETGKVVEFWQEI
jgi:hypothetical protein